MPLQLKEALDFSEVIEKAARTRVKDIPHRDLTSEQIDLATDRTSKMGGLLEPIRALRPGSTISSTEQVKFVKNSKYSSALMSSKTLFLEQEILRSSKEAFSLLDDMQKTISTLDVELVEDEVKTLDGYSQVHFNSFVRALDMGLDFDENPWSRDFKTNIPFLADNIATLTLEAGVTLPVLAEELIPFVEVLLVGEESDVGDSIRPLVSSDPRNIMFPNQVFKHIIVRQEFDETSRKYKKDPVYCTLLMELPGVQLLNTLEVRPLGSSTFFIDELTYINDNSEEATIDAINIEADRTTTLLFEPIKARCLKIKFVQYAPIERTEVLLGDTTTNKINEVLRGAGWSQYLPEFLEKIQGAIYDFSLESIRASLRTYDSLGVYVSRPRTVTGLVGCSLTDTVEAITISNDQRTYGRRTFLDQGEALLERYLGVRLYGRNDEVVVDELIPLRDGYPMQKEFLPLHGGESRFKLFPDINWSLVKTRAFADKTGDIYTVTTSTPIPGVEDKIVGVRYTDEDLRFVGPIGHEIVQGPTAYTVIDELTIEVEEYGSGNTSAITINTTPYLYAFFVTKQTNTIQIYKEDEQLEVGVDYELSFDDGASWVSEIPYGLKYSSHHRKLRAGDVRVKFTEPDYDKLYWTSYRVARDQRLGNGKKIRLKNGRVLIDRSLRNNFGELNTVYVFRAQQDNPYITPILLSYFLKIREQDVS